MTGRFRLTAPERHDGFYMIRVRRDGERPAGGAASGRTAEEAHMQALAIVRDVLAADVEREVRDGR